VNIKTFLIINDLITVHECCDGEHHFMHGGDLKFVEICRGQDCGTYKIAKGNNITIAGLHKNLVILYLKTLLGKKTI